MYNLLPISIILLSLAGIIIILIRKFPLVSQVNLKVIPREKQIKKRISLIEERLKRKIGEPALGLISSLEPPFKKFQDQLKRYYALILERQKIYQQRKEKEEVQENSQLKEEKIATLLAEGEVLVEKRALEEAEKKYIEAVKLDPQDIEAYRGLGRVYLAGRDFRHAEATFEHILKLTKIKGMEEASDYLEMGVILEEVKKPEKALKNFKKASLLEPNNPKYLDLLLESSIMLKKKNLAFEIFRKLKEVNPENQKLEEFEKRIREL